MSLRFVQVDAFADRPSPATRPPSSRWMNGFPTK
jgi:hypothetical protein